MNSSESQEIKDVLFEIPQLKKAAHMSVPVLTLFLTINPCRNLSC